MLLRRVWLTCGLVCALLLAGCGASSGAAVAPTATTRPTPSPTASPTATPQATTLYLGVGQTVYALDLRTGMKKWTYHTGQPEMVQGAYQAVQDVTVASGAVYFFDESDSSMYALSATDGSLLWKVGGVATGQGYITVMPNVVIASSGAIQAQNTTTAVDPRTGKTLWTQPMGASDLLPGAGVVYEARVLPGSDAEPVTNGTLKALNPTTGAVLWQATGHAYGALALMGNTLYANADDALHAFNAQTGAETWTFSLPKSTAAVSMWQDGTTLYLTNGTTLYAIDGATHTVRWHISSITTPGGVVENGVYCGPSGPVDEDMYGYDANTGAQKWHIQRPTGYAKVVADGGLCMATSYSEIPIVAVDAQTGAVRWSYTANISYVRTLASGGELFVLGSQPAGADSDTILRAVSETDGAVRWTFDAQDRNQGSIALG